MDSNYNPRNISALLQITEFFLLFWQNQLVWLRYVFGWKTRILALLQVNEPIPGKQRKTLPDRGWDWNPRPSVLIFRRSTNWTTRPSREQVVGWWCQGHRFKSQRRSRRVFLYLPGMGSFTWCCANIHDGAHFHFISHHHTLYNIQGRKKLEYQPTISPETLFHFPGNLLVSRRYLWTLAQLASD